MEYFKLETQHGVFKGRVPVIADDYDAALVKAIAKAKTRVTPVSDIIIFHVTEDKYSMNATKLKTIGPKR